MAHTQHHKCSIVCVDVPFFRTIILVVESHTRYPGSQLHILWLWFDSASLALLVLKPAPAHDSKVCTCRNTFGLPYQHTFLQGSANCRSEPLTMCSEVAPQVTTTYPVVVA